MPSTLGSSLHSRYCFLFVGIAGGRPIPHRVFRRLTFAGAAFRPHSSSVLSIVSDAKRWPLYDLYSGAHQRVCYQSCRDHIRVATESTAAAAQEHRPLSSFCTHIGICSSLRSVCSAKPVKCGPRPAPLQYLGIGILIIAAGGITTNLLIPLVTGRSSYSAFGPYFALPLVLLVGHAIIRHRLMDLRLVINRGITYLLASAFLSAVVILTTRLILFPGPYAEASRRSHRRNRVTFSADPVSASSNLGDHFIDAASTIFCPPYAQTASGASATSNVRTRYAVSSRVLCP